MRFHRDGIIMCLALLPIAFMVYVVYVWQTTGTFPFGLFSWTAPTISTPNLPEWSLPAPVQRPVEDALRSGPIVAVSVAVGLIGGAIAVGTLGDAVRFLARVLHRTDAPVEDAEVSHGPVLNEAPADPYFPG